MKSQTEKPIKVIYASIKSILENSRKRVIQNVIFEMVQTYWRIGEIIVEEELAEQINKEKNLIRERKIIYGVKNN